MTDSDDLVRARCARHAFVRHHRCPFCDAVLPDPQPRITRDDAPRIALNEVR